MSSFNDILNAPLPSKGDSFFEGSDGDMGFDVDSELKSLEEACNTEGCKSEGCRTEGCKSEACKSEGCRTEGCKTEDDNMSELAGLLAADPDDDAADLGEEDQVDSELSDLEGLLSVGNDDDDDDEDEDDDEEDENPCAGGECDEEGEDDIPVDPSLAVSVDDPTPAPPLEGEDDQDADNMMAIVATPMVLNDALTVEEAQDFIESGDADIAISEDLMCESALHEMMEDIFGGSTGDTAYTESVFASPNKPYKMTKKARFNQLYELSLQIEARAHHDPYVPRIEKAYRIERQIKAGWRKRYGQLAYKRAKKYLKKLMNSKSSGLKKAAKRFVNK